MNGLNNCVFDLPASSDEFVNDLSASGDEGVIDPPTRNDDVDVASYSNYHGQTSPAAREVSQMFPAVVVSYMFPASQEIIMTSKSVMSSMTSESMTSSMNSESPSSQFPSEMKEMGKQTVTTNSNKKFKRKK